jgi:hypothetical protein
VSSAATAYPIHVPPGSRDVRIHITPDNSFQSRWVADTQAPAMRSWMVGRATDGPHRWRWQATGPNGFRWGGALSEAVAKVRALRAYEELA